MNPLPYCVYVLFSEKDHQLYIGYTTDIQRRLSEHEAGKSASTKHRRPFILIFCEYYLYKSDAERREMYFKTSPGKRALKIMLKNALETLGHVSTQ